jgi:hypothetical protein
LAKESQRNVLALMKKEIKALDVALVCRLMVVENRETDTSQGSCLETGSVICLTFLECCIYSAF